MNHRALVGGSIGLVVIAGIFLWPKSGQSPVVIPDQVSGPYVNTPEEELVACTMDAQMCPDGTYVGRSGPACEFAPCAEVEASIPAEGMHLWEVYESNQLTFRYPVDVGTRYVIPVYWPPVIEKNTQLGSYRCDESDMDGKTEKRLVGAREYCRTASEVVGEKGMRDYKYVTYGEHGVVVLQVGMRVPDCTYYVDEEKEACESEIAFFDLDSVIDQIYRTIEFK